MYKAHGPDIPLTEIAKEAKVSRPTLYRNFPDRSTLILAVFHHNVDLLEQFASRNSGSKDAFEKLLYVILEQHVHFLPLVPFITEDDGVLYPRIEKIFEQPILDAKAAGILRSDFSVDLDLQVCISMIGGALTNPFQERADAGQRAMKWIFEGILAKK